MVHISADPYNPSGPPACNANGKVISMRVAAGIIETGCAILSKITIDDLCPDCLDTVAHLVIEVGRANRDES